MKEATTVHAVHPLLSERWSPRAFSGEPLESETVLTLLEAASWAASSLNEQPWRYYYAIKGSQGFDDMWNCLMPGNQPWAKDAGALVLCVAHKHMAKTGKPNIYAWHDCGLANANLVTQATAMDIYGHMMGGFDREKTRESFQLSTDVDPVCFIALGHIGTPEQLDEPLKSKELAPRSRKPFEEIVSLKP